MGGGGSCCWTITAAEAIVVAVKNPAIPGLCAHLLRQEMQVAVPARGDLTRHLLQLCASLADTAAAAGMGGAPEGDGALLQLDQLNLVISL